jgi:hypothetical protein
MTALLCVIALTACAQDKIGKDKAPAVATKMLAEVQKKKSAAIKEANQLGERAGGATQFEGVLRKDFAAVKGTMEIYARGALYLVNTGGRFDPPGELKGQEGLQATSFRNPALFLTELGKLVPSANFGGDENVGGKDCRVVDFLCDPSLIRQYLKELGERVEKALAGADGQAGLFGAGGIFRLTNAFDEKGTLATMRVCVGKDDLLPYKFEFVIRPKIKPGSLPPEIRVPDLSQKTEIHFSRWDEENPFDIPGFVKAKWGVK